MITLYESRDVVGAAPRFAFSRTCIDAVYDDPGGGASSERYLVLSEWNSAVGAWLPNHRARRRGVERYTDLRLRGEAQLRLSFHGSDQGLLHRDFAWELAVRADEGRVSLLADGDFIAVLGQRGEWQILAKDGIAVPAVAVCERPAGLLRFVPDRRDRLSLLAERAPGGSGGSGYRC